MFDFDELEEKWEETPDVAAGSAPLGANTACLPDQTSVSYDKLYRLFGSLNQFEAVKSVPIPAGSKLRVACISDIHVDAIPNRKWLRNHMPDHGELVLRGVQVVKRFFDVLILPGDVAEDPKVFEETMVMFLNHFDLVCFTPGNHELWLHSVQGRSSAKDSMAKLRSLLDICTRLGVHIHPVRLMCSDEDPDVLIVPLLSWYTSEWDREPDLPYKPKKQIGISDFMTINWPTDISNLPGFSFGLEGTSPVLSDLFARVNVKWLDALQQQQLHKKERKSVVVSFSHFLPRQELFPEKRFLFDGDLHKVSGSDCLEAQIRSLKPDLHICGHTHMAIDLVLEGQRYLQWPLGVPHEWQMANTVNVGQTGILIIYNAEHARKLAPLQYTFWGNFYAKSKRVPSEFCPAPWLRARLMRDSEDIELPNSDDYFWTKTLNPGFPQQNYEELYEKVWRM